MNISIFLFAIFGVNLGLAQRGERDCDKGHGVSSGRELQDIYQRPSVYDTGSYIPHTSYGPPDLPPRRNYPQDTSEGENSPRPTYVRPPSYNEVLPAAVYGPPPSRARVAAAAGIYDDYEDIQYAQSPPPPPVVRRYSNNYAQREPYQPRYDAYASRRPEYRVPVYYSPLIPDGFIPVHSHLPTPSSTEKSTTEEARSQPTSESYHSEHHHQSSSTEHEEVFDETQVRRQQPTVVAVNTSPFGNEIKRRLFRKPFVALRNLFRGSILAKRNQIGLIPSFVQGSTNNFT